MGARHTPRVTNGQRAAVCGLVIAGVSFADACAIVAVSRIRVKAVLPKRWAASPRPGARRYMRWTGKTLEQIRLAYLDRSLEGGDIARRFNIDVGYVYRLARLHGWPRRGKRARLPKKFNTERQRLLFNKLRRHGISHIEAFAEAMR